MLSFNSSLLSIASEFVGNYAPFQSVQVTPAPNGGVYIASTDKGNIVCLAHDPAGEADETVHLLPSKEIARATKLIKTGERNIRIEEGTAVITTYKKTTNQIQELPILKSSIPFPKEFYPALKTCIDRWSLTPKLSETAGRYSSTYISKAVKALGSIDSSITFSAFDGGPLRIQGSDSNLMILIFPQTAAPIPHLPDWFGKYATTCSAP